MGNRIKVLSVCTSDTSGGAARAAYRIHLAVRDCGIDSRMFVKEKGTTDPNVIPLSDFLPRNAFYRAYDWVRNKVKNKWQHYQWGKYPKENRYFMSDLRSTDIGGALQRLDYDVLHLHWVNLRFLPLDKLPKDKPIVWTLHDSWPFCGVCHYYFDCKRYEVECGCCPQLGAKSDKDISNRIWNRKRKLYQRLDLHIVCPSHWLGECAAKSGLLGRFPVTVIPNCLDAHLFRPLKEAEISPKWSFFQKKRLEKPFVLFGAMNAATDKRKGFSNLLSALRLLEKEGKGDLFELIVFGADKPLEGMPVSFPTHYVGYVKDADELVSLYNIASVMVVPSLTEVFGQTASEAMACGVPVVAFKCTGIQDVVDHIQNGYLAIPYDDNDLARGIIWCLENNKDGRLSDNARRKVLENYTPEVVGRLYANLYSDLYSDGVL